jgi:hypothetical protein
MVTKPGLAGYESARSSSGNVPRNCERRWKQNDKRDECRVSGRMNQNLVVDGRADRLCQ